MRWCVVVLLAGCWGASSPTAKPEPKPVAPPSDEGARRFAHDFFTAYETYTLKWFDGRFEDAGLFMSNWASAVWDAKELRLVTQQQFTERGERQRINPDLEPLHFIVKRLDVGMAPDGKSAWVTELIDIDTGQNKPNPYRWVAVLIDRDGFWQASAWHASVPLPQTAAYEQAQAGKSEMPKAIAERVDGEAKSVLATFDRDIARRAFDIAEREDVGVIGPAADHFWVGAAAKDGIAEIFAHAKVVRHGARAHVVPGAQLGWVMTNTDFTVDVDGKTLVVPYRVLATYVQTGGTWKLVLLHVSHAVPG